MRGAKGPGRRGIDSQSHALPLKHVFQRKPTRTRVLSSGHRTHGRLATPSRQARWRIRRPTGDERARSPCKVCPKSLSKVSVQSLCPKSLSKVSVNPLQVLPRPRTFRVRRSSWCAPRPLGAPLGRKSCLPKRLPTNFKKMSLT